MGIFPDTYETFIQELGEQATKKTQTRKTIANTIRKHTHRMFKLDWKLDRESKQTEMGEPENPTQHTDDDITDNTSGNHSLNTETQMESCYNNNEDFNIEEADHEFQWLFPTDSQAQRQEEAETSDEEDNFTLQDLPGEESLRPRPRPPLAPMPLRGREGGGCPSPRAAYRQEMDHDS